MDLRKFRDLVASEELYFRRADLFKDKSDGLVSATMPAFWPSVVSLAFLRARFAFCHRGRRLLRLFRNRRQTSDLVCDLAAGGDQIRDQSVINIEDSFVLGPIPHIVALRQDSP